MHSGNSFVLYLRERASHLMRVPEKEDPVASSRGIFKLKLNTLGTFVQGIIHPEADRKPFQLFERIRLKQGH